MMLSLAFAFQLAVATTPTVAGASPASLTVKDASRTISVALVAAPGGPLLRADQLKPVVPITVSHLTESRWMLIVNGTGIEVEDGIRFAKVGDQTYQLASPPEVRKGALYVPMQLVVEIIARIVPNLAWDPERFELRAFSSTQKFASREAAAARAVPRRASKPVDAHSDRVPSTVNSAAPLGPLRARRLVVVDAGHGGPDAGMHGPIGRGPELIEKEVTLDVAKRVGAALGRRGIDVKYTRTTDTLIALGDRGRMANDARADLFLSIHVNAANPSWRDPGGARGFETYFLAEAKTEDARRLESMENEAVRFESGPSASSGDPLNSILNDMVQNESLRESNELADLIQRRMGEVHPGPSRGVKQAGFMVLVKSFMPAVLVEIGFGTNPSEAAYLNDARKMDVLAGAISDAVLEYLKRYERRVAATSDTPGGVPSPR